MRREPGRAGSSSRPGPGRRIGALSGTSLDSQVSELARILDELKTERAQAAVEGAELRRKGTERLSEAVVKSLGRIHKVLSPEQRDRLAYLIRTGALAF